MATEDDNSPDPTTPLNSLLADLEEAQLRQVIHSLVDEQPDLLEIVRQEVEWLRQSSLAPIKVDIPAIRREIRKGFQSIGMDKPRYGSWYSENLVTSHVFLNPHIDAAKRLLDAADAPAATAVLQAVIEQWVAGLSELEDWIYEQNEDPIAEVNGDLDAAFAEVLLSQELSSADRDSWKAQLDAWAETVIYLPVTEAALDQWWDYPPVVAAMRDGSVAQSEHDDDEVECVRALARARLNVLERLNRTQEYLNLALAEGEVLLYLQMLARTDQTQNVVEEALLRLTTASSALSLAELLDSQGRQAEAEAVAAHGLTLGGGYAQTELGRWTARLAQRTGNLRLALQAALVAFSYSQELGDYKLVERLAGPQWPTLREDLLESVAKFPGYQSTDIYLYERMLPELIAAVDRDEVFDSMLDDILAQTRSEYPDWSIAQAKRPAEAIMDSGDAPRYADAVAWLRLARDIYREHEREPEWVEYLSSIRQQHGRKYKLIGLLREFE